MYVCSTIFDEKMLLPIRPSTAWGIQIPRIFHPNKFRFSISKKINMESIKKKIDKGVVCLDLKWKYDVKLFPAKKLASHWLTSKVSQSETSFLAGNSLTSYFHLKSKPIMPLVNICIISILIVDLRFLNCPHVATYQF